MGNLLRRRTAGQVDPDAAWRQQNKESRENPMYKFADLGGGGRLGDAYVKGGEVAVEKIAYEEFPYWLYKAGKGQVLTKVDYARWMNRCKAKMMGKDLTAVVVDTQSDEQVLTDFTQDEFNKFTEHTACWNISQRGGVGETPLHLLYLMDQSVHTATASVLLRIYPKLALDFYEGDEYYGEGSLHIAIINNDIRSSKLLIECGADVNLRATGRFFLPEDQKKGKTKSTNYEGYAYYGEYPLAFAACMGYKNIYDYLITKGADPNLQDSFGNTVLHMIVISNQTDMFTYAVRHHGIKANMFTKNKQGLTPLTLAAKLGRSKLFEVIMELGSIDNWRYSNIKCSVYPLAALDTINPSGETNWKSALMFIIDGETSHHLDMLESGVIRQLLDEKWKTFARRRFFERLFLAMMHLAILSVAIYTRPVDGLLNGSDAVSVVRYVAEIIIVLNCIIFLVFELFEVKSQGFIGLLKNLRNAPAQAIFTISCILLIVCVPFRFCELQVFEETLLIIALPGAWSFLLFFARLHYLLGPNVIMMYRMVTHDIVRFIIIYTIIILGFGQAFYFLFKDIKSTTITTFLTPYGSVMTLIKMTFGEFEYGDFDQIHYPALAKGVFFVFMILVPILLLNMLIAMMGNTYHQVISKSEKEWRRQWAKVVIVLERTFSKQTILQYQNKYSVPLAGPPDDYNSDDVAEELPFKGGSHRALMVIKTSMKTRARQRKGAINNWRKLCGEVKKRIKLHKAARKGGAIFRDLDFDLPSSDEDDINTLSNHQSKRPVSGHSQKNLTSALAQLAWEKDIDLTKGTAFSRRKQSTPRQSQAMAFGPVGASVNGSCESLTSLSYHESDKVPLVSAPSSDQFKGEINHAFYQDSGNSTISHDRAQ